MPDHLRKPFRDTASFVIVAVLIFCGLALALEGGIATGPNQWVYCGLTGWLELHRYGSTWSVEHIHPLRMAIEALLALLATWLLSKVLHGTRKQA